MTIYILYRGSPLDPWPASANIFVEVSMIFDTASRPRMHRLQSIACFRHSNICNNSQFALCCQRKTLMSRGGTAIATQHSLRRALLVKSLYDGVFNPDQDLVLFAKLHSFQPVAIHSRSNNRNLRNSHISLSTEIPTKLQTRKTSERTNTFQPQQQHHQQQP